MFKEVSRVEEVVKSSKLAAEGDRRGGLLIPLYSEPEDSGIDSDDTDCLAASAQRFDDGRLQISDASSSDEDRMVKPPWVKTVKKKNDELLKAMEDEQLESRDLMVPMMPWQYQQLSHDASIAEDSADRNSPPLYEVELTASDEDDDASVLELVIPMQQSSRYQRVPTSSPMKTKPRAPGFCYLFCCFRK